MLQERAKVFEKSKTLYPIKNTAVFLGGCSVCPLHSLAAMAMEKFNRAQTERGIQIFAEYHSILPRFHQAMGELLRVDASAISYTTNTAEGINLIANGYPFEPGDEVISYQHEYPSNYYPWQQQEKRGVTLRLLQDSDGGSSQPAGTPRAWDFAQLESLVSKRTRIIALSHVQYSSGFAADLATLGSFCRERGIDLVIDAAQSLGCLPIYPEEMGVSAIAAPGWKWLMGPLGSGVLYTQASFREKLSHTMSGSSLQRQEPDYLDLSWNPHSDGRRFEYSTVTLTATVGLTEVLNEVFGKYSVESIRDEVFRLQDRIHQRLNPEFFSLLKFPHLNRSGIRSYRTSVCEQELSKQATLAGVVSTPRAGYFRIAPLFFLADEEVDTAAEKLNSIAERLPPRLDS